MAPRILLLAALALLGPAALAGSWHSGGGASGLVAHPAAFHLNARVRSLILTNRQGRRTTVPLPGSRELSQGLPVPAGDWAEITVVFDGPVFLVGSPGGPVPLAIQTLTAPLERPDATEDRMLFLDLALPDGLRGPALLAAVADGVLAVEVENE